MQKTLPILGLFAILIVGLTAPAMAEYDKWDEKYKQLEDEFEDKRHHIEKHFQEEFEELDRSYEEQKMAIYEKIDSSELSDSEIDAMFDELFLEFDEKRQSLDSDMMKQIMELEEMFEKELRYLDEQANDYYVNADGTYRDSSDYEEYEDYKDPYEYDPEWETIEPLAKRIMEMIPMEKIERLWEAGEIEQLAELIVSETDLTYDQAKRVIVFFEKYDDRDYDDDYHEYDYHEYDYEEYDTAGNPKYDYEEYDYEEYDYPVADDGTILKLEQRIAELEGENQLLRETIAELEEKIDQINAVLIEQVKFIYEWVQSQ